MPYGYLGTTPNQQKANSGVFSVEEALSLQKAGELGGSLEHIETQTHSGSVSTVIFDDLRTDKYDIHFMELINVQSDSDGDGTRFVLYEDGVGYETANVYQWARRIQKTNGTGTDQQNNAVGYMSIFGTTDNNTNYKNHAYVYWYNLGNSSKYSFNTVMSAGKSYYETGFNFGGSSLSQASKITKIKFELSSGNFSSYTIKLYGIKQT